MGQKSSSQAKPPQRERAMSNPNAVFQIQIQAADDSKVPIPAAAAVAGKARSRQVVGGSLGRAFMHRGSMGRASLTAITQRPRYKILVLGPSDTGKTTFVKHILATYGGGFDFENHTIKLACEAARRNIIVHLKRLCDIARARSKTVPELQLQPTSEPASKFMLELKVNPELDAVQLTPEVVRHAKTLWSDPAIQACYKQRNRAGFVLEGGDNLNYLMDSIDRIAADTWVPTNDDIIRGYAATRGLHTHLCDVNNHPLTIVDAGGKLSERCHWPLSYEGSNAVLFFISASSYDEILAESGAARMEDALKLFRDTCSLEEFVDTPFFIVINKVDRFREKITEVPLSAGYFREYEGKDPSADAALQYIREKFESVFVGPRANLYVQLIAATRLRDVSTLVESALHVISIRPSPKVVSNPLNKVFSNADLMHGHPTT